MRRRVAFLPILAALLVGAGPSLPDCCNDPLSCAGAIVSGGTTCLVDAALNEIKSLITQLGNQRSQGQTDFDANLTSELQEVQTRWAQYNAGADRLVAELDQLAAAADQLTKNEVARLNAGISAASLSGKGPAQPPASGSGGAQSQLSRESMQGLLNDPSLWQMKSQLDAEVQAGHKDHAQIRAAIQDAGQKISASARGLLTLYSARFVEPLGNLIVTLEVCLGYDPVKVLACCGAVGSALGTIESDVTNAVTPVVDDAVTKSWPALMTAPAAPYADLQSHAGRAAAIFKKMSEALRFQRPAERQQALAGLPPPVSGATSSFQGSASPLKGSGLVLNSVQRSAAGLAPLRNHLAEIASRKPAPNLAQYRGNLSRQLDAAFTGKSAAAAAETHQALIADARRRYGSNPKLLADVEKLLDDEGRVRGVRP